MHAIVMEKKKRICAVLCDDGCFRKIAGNFDVGQEISVIADSPTTCHIRGKKNRHQSMYRLFLPYAAAALIIIAAGLSYMYETALAYSYVTVDVNPSIEYTLNRLNRVINVTALNDDAAEVVDALSDSLKNKSLSDALSETVAVLQENNYLLGDDASILIDVVPGSERSYSDLSGDISEAFDDSNISLCLLESNIASRQEAIDSGMSTGRLEAMKQIADNTPLNETDSFTGDNSQDLSTLKDVYKSLPVKEILSEYSGAEGNGNGPSEIPGEIPEENTTDKQIPIDDPESLQNPDIPSGDNNNPDLQIAPDSKNASQLNEASKENNSVSENAPPTDNMPTTEGVPDETNNNAIKEPVPQDTGSKGISEMPSAPQDAPPPTN